MKLCRFFAKVASCVGNGAKATWNLKCDTTGDTQAFPIDRMNEESNHLSTHLANTVALANATSVACSFFRSLIVLP